MSGYLLTQFKNEYFGCGACFQVCTSHAIRMTKDNEGFLYPTIDSEKSVKCNLCRKVCSAERLPDKKDPIQAWVAFHNDSYIRQHSASGGALKSIIESADDKGIDMALNGTVEALFPIIEQKVGCIRSVQQIKVHPK